MSSEAPFLDTNDQTVKNDSSQSRLIIQRPDFLSKVCTIKTESDHLPPIGKRRPKNLTDDKKVSSESLSSWLKPGISLPKLTSKSTEKSLTEEPISPFASEFAPCSGKVLSDCFTLMPCQTDLTPTVSTCRIRMEKGDLKETFRSAVGPSQCSLPFYIPSSDLLCDKGKMLEEKLEESHALKQWEIWLNRRKRVQDDLKKKLNRHECQMAFNRQENYRKTVEDKELLALRQIREREKEFKKIKYTDKNEKKKAELMRNMIPQIKIIGTPLAIQKEKNLLCSNIPVPTGIRKCYFKVRAMMEVKGVVDTDELAVVGHSITEKIPENENKPEPTRALPKIIVTEPDQKEKEHCQDLERTSVFCLVIEGTEFKYELGKSIKPCLFDSKDSFKMENPTWNIDFGLCQEKKLIEKVIKVQNRGTVAVKYEWIWKAPPEKPLLQILRPCRYEPWFFFNKNSGIFLPGQNYNLKFFLRANKSGVRMESWLFKTFPVLFPNIEFVTFNLTAVATEEGFKSDVVCVENYLNRRLGESIVNTVINECIYESVRPDYNLQHIEYRALLSEQDLFEFYNPHHYYRSSAVNRLKEIFSEVCPKNQKTWDLCLATLIDAIRQNVNDRNERELRMREVCNCAKDALRPRHVKVKKNKKYSLIYQILCKMFNYTEVDYKNLKNRVMYLDVDEGTEVRYWEENSEEDKEENINEEESSRKSLLLEGEKNTLTTIKILNKDESTSIDVLNDYGRFYTILYLKVYGRLCTAVEEIAGVIETRKFLEPWEKKKFTDYS